MSFPFIVQSPSSCRGLLRLWGVSHMPSQGQWGYWERVLDGEVTSMSKCGTDACWGVGWAGEAPSANLEQTLRTVPPPPSTALRAVQDV